MAQRKTLGYEHYLEITEGDKTAAAILLLSSEIRGISNTLDQLVDISKDTRGLVENIHDMASLCLNKMSQVGGV